MKDKQTLFDFTTSILEKIRNVLLVAKPNVVLVHGDTSTPFVIALACFNLKIRVVHMEAGSRTIISIRLIWKILITKLSELLDYIILHLPRFWQVT